MSLTDKIQLFNSAVQLMLLALAILALLCYGIQARAAWQNNLSGVYRSLFDLMDRRRSGTRDIGFMK